MGAIAVAVVAALAFLAQYFACERLALRCMGAREVEDARAPRLHAAMRRVCVAAELPLPRLGLAATAVPNAFTIGRTPSTATVCVTGGLLDLLDDSELEAVLAHELAHVARRDVTVMTIAGCFASIAGLLSTAGSRRAAASADADRPPNVVLVVVSGLVFLLSHAIVQALSRRRELCADAAAGRLTGDSGALAAALQRIDAHLRALPERERRGICGELVCLDIVAADVPATVATLFATHPPLRDRVEALGRLRSADGATPGEATATPAV
jgi:heat shock protein HtpX